MFDATSSDEFNKTLQEIRSRLPYNARTMEKSNWYGLLICVRQAVVAVVVVVALQRINLAGSGRAVLSAFAFGVVAYRVQFILHDASHKTLFRSLTLNELVGWAFGMLIGVNFARYRYTHMWHHRLTGSVNDPQYRDYLHGTVSPIRYLTFLLGPLVGSRVIPYLGREFLTRNGDRKFDQHEPRVRISWYVCALVVVSIELLLLSNFGSQPSIAFGFLFGLPSVSLFLARLRAVAEHQDFVADRTGFTRSHKFNIFDFVILYDANFNYHFEHHLYPGICSRHLKDISEHVDRLGRPEDTLGRSMFRTLIRGFGS